MVEAWSRNSLATDDFIGRLTRHRLSSGFTISAGRAVLLVDQIVNLIEPTWYRLGRGDGLRVNAGEICMSVQVVCCLVEAKV
jgi:hypothetical protein